MSATAVLVPILEPEAEALLDGDAHAIISELRARAALLRRRIARVDTIREELHALLFSKWEKSLPKHPGMFAALSSLWKKPEPAQSSKGYDPFVHLFGRSLPVAAPDSKLVADRLTKLLSLEEDAFVESLGAELALLDPKARTLWSETRPLDAPPALEGAITEELTALERAMRSEPPKPAAALDAIVKLSAWSRPVWRFDGDMLPDLLRTLGIGVELSPAVELFEARADESPALEAALKTLPMSLGSFAGAGAWLSSSQVKLVGGALRLQRGRLATNAAQSENPTIVMRHVRLLEEAVFFCEENGFALSEAAGVEWHEREPVA